MKKIVKIYADNIGVKNHIEEDYIKDDKAYDYYAEIVKKHIEKNYCELRYTNDLMEIEDDDEYIEKYEEIYNRVVDRMEEKAINGEQIYFGDYSLALVDGDEDEEGLSGYGTHYTFTEAEEEVNPEYIKVREKEIEAYKKYEAERKKNKGKSIKKCR